MQADLITMLAGTQTKLFFIGDDKQSIYKFQGADLTTFTSRQKKINASDDIDQGQISLEFEHSFRSAPPIVDFVNNIFSLLLSANHAHVEYRAKYRALQSSRSANVEQSIETSIIQSGESSDHQPNHIHLIELPSSEEAGSVRRAAVGMRAEQAPPLPAPRYEVAPTDKKEIAGNAVANWIKAKVEQKVPVFEKNGLIRPINYGDFAVLVPGNNDFLPFESALSNWGIPYVTSGGKTFLQRQEIYDLENMLLFLSNLSDSYALLAVLRSPMFAITDDLIHKLATETQYTDSSLRSSPLRVHPAMPNETVGADCIRPFETTPISETVGAGASPPIRIRPFTMWQSLQNQAQKRQPGYELVSNAVLTLKRLLSDLPVLTLSELVYKIIRATNYDLIALSLPDGKQRFKNIWKLHTLAAQKEEMGALEFAQFLNKSRELSVTQTNAPIDSSQSVKLMTIHAAKGLEFPAVILPALSGQNYRRKNKLLFDSQFGIVLDTTRTKQESKDDKPLAYRLSKVLHDDMDIAEKKRLLYVAMTRARDHLALFIHPEDRGETAASWLRPLLETFPRETPDLQSLTPTEIVGATQGASDETTSIPEIVGAGHAPPGALNERLLEPSSMHLGLAPLPAGSSLIERVTPSPSFTEPDARLTGNFFHKLMEFLPQKKANLTEDELYALAGQLGETIAHPQLIKALIEQGKKLLSIYSRSDFQSMITTAKTICHEWSYYREADDQLKLYRPDLLLETQDSNWYLIDYKTDHFPVKDIEQQALRHRRQLDQYCADFTAFTGIKPQFAIYFAQHGLLHRLP